MTMAADPILIVDDNAANLKVARFALVTEGYDVRTAVDGEQAVLILQEFRPRLILMDIQLPIIDGHEATRRIKSNPDLRHIPIIAITSYALSGDEAKAREAGCDAYVTKPYSPRLLLAKIREYLV